MKLRILTSHGFITNLIFFLTENLIIINREDLFFF